jgi:hypothetical protein
MSMVAGSRRSLFNWVAVGSAILIASLLYRFHSYLNRFESLESLKFSDFFCGALDRNVIRS